MIKQLLDNGVEFVINHNRIVILALLIMTAGMMAGLTNLETESEAEQSDMFPDTEASEKADYIADRYGSNETETTAHTVVYVRETDGNALSKDVLLDTLHYQQTVRENESVAAATPEGDSVVGAANVVAKQAADDSDATLDEQITALESTSEDEVESLVESTFTADSDYLHLLPTSYEPGTATAESHRMIFEFNADEDNTPPSDATAMLFEQANEQEHTEYFTLGEHALLESQDQNNENTISLVLPAALVLILGVLALTYRDVIDVVVGMVGVIVSILWMFGILGWLGISAGMTMIVGPVVIAGLSIDYGFHVFTRYREYRNTDAEIRPSMGHALRAVLIALSLVTITTGIGFLSNVVNPLENIRNLGIGITLGVISSFVIFATLVPALKISLDGIAARLGFDRRNEPLGERSFLKPILGSSVTLAKRWAPIIVVASLLVGAGAAATWTALDEEPFERQAEPTAEWKSDLPGPLAWEDPDYNVNERYVNQEYRPIASDESDRFQILVEGSVTDDQTLLRIEDGLVEAEETGLLDRQRDSNNLVSPLTVMQSVAERNDEFASTLEAADTDGDGIPDSDLESVYDHLYEIEPETASQIIERADGEYQSVRVIGPPDGGGSLSERATAQQTVASAIETDASDLTATAVSTATIMQMGIEEITDGILQVLVLALSAVFVTYVVISRYLHGSATLGAVTVVPIALVTALVIGGMYVLNVPLTLVTALLMSLVIGLGIDYNIHLSDRFIQELQNGRETFDALEVAVIGTGGALLGSALTTAIAFSSILLHPHPQLQNFGTLVILALLMSFLVSVFVLPSILSLWARYVPSGDLTDHSAETEPALTND